VLSGADLHMAERVGERVRKLVAAKPFLAAPGCHLSITVSLGIACLQTVEDAPEDLLKRADQALYRAKREGRNRVSLSAA
jgi:two-component system cell cycle response regulator